MTRIDQSLCFIHAGTGKTVSVIEAILQVLKTGRTSSLKNDNEMWSRREQRPVRILACAPSDAAAGNGGQTQQFL
jgi:hypothetical protein